MDENIHIGIGTPTDSPQQVGELVDNSALVVRGDKAVDLAIQATSHGGARISTVIRDSDAPLRYSFPISGGSPVIDSDGSVSLEVTSGESTLILDGVVKAPWAYDAEGSPVPTHFEVDGESLVQVVDHTAREFVYPVVADPEWGWEGVILWAYLNKQETRDVAAGDVAPVVCAPLLAVAGPVLAALCAANTAAITIKASQAVDRGICITASFAPGVVVASFYEGRRCWR